VKDKDKKLKVKWLSLGPDSYREGYKGNTGIRPPIEFGKRIFELYVKN